MHPALRKQCTSTITVLPHASKDGAGDVTYGPLHTYKGFIDSTVVIARDTSGQEVVSQNTLYLVPEAYGITVMDKILLPNGESPLIINISTLLTHTGEVAHLELYL